MFPRVHLYRLPAKIEWLALGNGITRLPWKNGGKKKIFFNSGHLRVSNWLTKKSFCSEPSLSTLCIILWNVLETKSRHKVYHCITVHDYYPHTRHRPTFCFSRPLDTSHCITVTKASYFATTTCVTAPVSLPSLSSFHSAGPSPISPCFLHYSSWTCLCKMLISLSTMPTVHFLNMWAVWALVHHQTPEIPCMYMYFHSLAEQSHMEPSWEYTPFICDIKPIREGEVRIITPWHVKKGRLWKENLSRPPPIYTLRPKLVQPKRPYTTHPEK